ncbi:HTH domain-containing protein [Cryomorpha ignava]|uniref:HTH domain-containing protein n=1 Tax=Cryomorpha ignava TaxID=101383 RepID=A0A7K3WNI4_9FLAO|nr:RNA-binding domain-containing protein [Cryomorpha ignava]NEN22265.1 HTH domain-containing protein [Cryomorpha ignava]
MTKGELIHKINDLEWEDFEVKEAKAELPKSAWSTVSAFANTSGGWLVFGVKQIGRKFEIQGVRNPEKIEQDFLATLRSKQKFNAATNAISVKHVFDDKTVIAFYIPASDKKPIYYNTQSNTFIRRGSADQKATSEEIDAMYREQTFGTKSSEIVPRSSITNLKIKSVKEYRDYMARFNPDVSYNRFEESEFLTKLRVLDTETGNCTFGGLLFFGKREELERFFPDFRIDLLQIPGTSYRNALSRYTYRLNEDEYENLWECYFACFKRLRTEVDVEFKLSTEGFGEELSPGLKAVREALINMLMHADYFSPAHSRIRIFSNHIEFYNPGGLPKPLEELKLKDLSIPRNPVLAKLFRMVKLAENAGYGFDKIESNWYSYNKSAPEYVLDFDSIILKLYTKPKAVSSEQAENDGKMSERCRIDVGTMSERIREVVGKNADAVFLILASNPHISAERIANEINKSQRTIEREIEKLRSAGFIERVGPKLGGYWKIKTGESSKEVE